MLFLDLIQRCYTDNGNGQGHLTMEGQRFLRYIGFIPKTLSKGYDAVLIDAVFWSTGPLATSRNEVVEKYQRLMDLADANFGRPLREATWHSYEKEYYERDRMKSI